MYDRVLQASPATASVTYYEDGAVVDPGTVTIGITREDGTTLVAAGTATTGTGAAARTFALTATHTASLDLLTLTWTSATKGTRTSYIEVRGGFLFTVSDARALDPLDNTTVYTTAEIIEARTLAETALEEACGVSFVPTYARDKLDGSGDVDLLLPHPRPLEVTSATVDDTALTVADLELYRDGRVYYSSKWTGGRRNVEVKYVHGYATPPPRVGSACLKLAKRYLVDSPHDDRVIQHTSPDGVSQMWMTAGIRGNVFDIPECVAVVSEYGMKSSVG